MRWAKMSKYISQFDWQPVVYTPLNGEVPVHDESLVKEIPNDIEVIRTPIWEPYGFYKAFLSILRKIFPIGSASGTLLANNFRKQLTVSVAKKPAWWILWH